MGPRNWKAPCMMHSRGTDEYLKREQLRKPNEQHSRTRYIVGQGMQVHQRLGADADRIIIDCLAFHMGFSSNLALSPWPR
jgi:hypothetical protein